MLIIQSSLWKEFFSRNSVKFFITIVALLILLIPATIADTNNNSELTNTKLYGPIETIKIRLLKSNSTKKDLIQRKNRNQIFQTNSNSIQTQLFEQPQQNISEVLQLFDSFDIKLQALNLNLNLNATQSSFLKKKRKIRDTNLLGKRTQCTVARDKLNSLKDEIKNVLNTNFQTQESYNNNCELDLNINTDNCEKLIKLIQCGVNHLKNGFTNSKQNGASLEDFIKLKNTYDDLSEKYNKELDEVRRSSSQEYQQKLDQVKTDLQFLQQSLNEVLNKFKATSVSFCIAEIHGGRIKSALKVFNELQNDSKLRTIILQAYNSLSDKINHDANNKLNNFENILEFCNQLESKNQKLLAYRAFFDALKENEHLDNPKVLFLDDAIKLLLKSAEEVSLSGLKDELDQHVQNILKAWASSKEFSKLKAYAEQSVEAGETLSMYLPGIVRIVYANNLANFDKTLKFLNELSSREQTVIGCKFLYIEMLRNGQLHTTEAMKFAYTVKTRDWLSELKAWFPAPIRNLIWHGDKCTIQNRQFEEYLYAASDYHNYDDKRRRVLTWRPGGPVLQGFWRFKPLNEINLFEIYNNKHNEELFASSNGEIYDDDRRRAFTWRSGKPVIQGNWRMEPIDGKYFQLYNMHYREYLYAANNELAHDGDRRNVFTWRPGGDLSWKSQWLVDCDSGDDSNELVIFVVATTN